MKTHGPSEKQPSPNCKHNANPTMINFKRKMKSKSKEEERTGNEDLIATKNSTLFSSSSLFKSRFEFKENHFVILSIFFQCCWLLAKANIKNQLLLPMMTLKRNIIGEFLCSSRKGVFIYRPLKMKG